MLKKTGAEAVVRLVDFDGHKAVLKERVKKGYREKELDNKLRSQRTKMESRMISAAKRAGVNAPSVFLTDEKNHALYLENLEGPTLKEYIASNLGNAYRIAEEWGAAIARLHSAGIVHGDLTTSNAIVRGDGVFIIDFGLSFLSHRDEDLAEDINLLRQSLRATHNEDFKGLWKSFITGYVRYAESERILKRSEEIANRGRYLKRGSVLNNGCVIKS